MADLQLRRRGRRRGKDSAAAARFAVAIATGTEELFRANHRIRFSVSAAIRRTVNIAACCCAGRPRKEQQRLLR
ncbi:MAG: hypothetical protein ABR526_04225 [Chthoniobacterales bacterium]